jgi:hypothetical protein
MTFRCVTFDTAAKFCHEVEEFHCDLREKYGLLKGTENERRHIRERRKIFQLA